MSCYLVQEDLGSGCQPLHPGGRRTGFILLEFCEEPPTPGELPWQCGDRRLYNERIRRHPPSEDEMMLISVILSES